MRLIGEGIVLAKECRQHHRSCARLHRVPRGIFGEGGRGDWVLDDRRISRRIDDLLDIGDRPRHVIEIFGVPTGDKRVGNRNAHLGITFTRQGQRGILRAQHLIEHGNPMAGGMPLAIELAAAWLRVLPCAQIARAIERDLNFLTTRLRDVPDRHHSIQAVFEHSWRLLSPSEQTTFQQLSIFRGGFHRNAAAQVAGASWLDLAALVEKSLLSVDATGRYSVHELLRQYGAGKLEMDPAEQQATVAHHCLYIADFLGERLEVINGEAQHQAANEIATELDNIRAAWQWSLQQRRLDDIRRIISTYYSFCQLQSRFLEGIQALQAAQVCLETLEPTHQRDLTLAYVLNHQGWLYIRLGQLDQAAAALQHSRDLYTQLNVPPQTIMGGDSRVALAIVYLIQGDYRRAIELSEEARRVAEGYRSQHNLAFAHYALTAAQLALGDYAAGSQRRTKG